MYAKVLEDYESCLVPVVWHKGYKLADCNFARWRILYGNIPGYARIDRKVFSVYASRTV